MILVVFVIASCLTSMIPSNSYPSSTHSDIPMTQCDIESNPPEYEACMVNHYYTSTDVNYLPELPSHDLNDHSHSHDIHSHDSHHVDIHSHDIHSHDSHHHDSHS